MQVPQTVSAWILAHFSNEIVLLIIINIFLLIVGMVMDTTPAILILSPILLPIVQSIGMNPIHFGVVMIVNLAIGFVTPADRSQSVCGKFADRCAGHAYCKKGNADDRVPFCWRCFVDGLSRQLVCFFTLKLGLQEA